MFSWFLVVFFGFPDVFPTPLALFSSLRFCGGVSVDRNFPVVFIADVMNFAPRHCFPEVRTPCFRDQKTYTNIREYFPSTGLDVLPAVLGHRATSHDWCPKGLGRIFPTIRDPRESPLCIIPLCVFLAP